MFWGIKVSIQLGFNIWQSSLKDLIPNKTLVIYPFLHILVFCKKAEVEDSLLQGIRMPKGLIEAAFCAEGGLLLSAK